VTTELRYLTEQSPVRNDARLRAVLNVGRKITSILDLDHLLVEAVRLLRETFSYDVVAIYLRDPHDPNYYFASHSSNWHEHHSELGRYRERRHISQGMVGWVLRNEQSRIANDTSQDPYYLSVENLSSAELDLPLKYNNRVIGVLNIESAHLNAFDPADVPFLEILADQLAVAIENARLAGRAREAAIAEERNRLARNLHDDTVQTLIGIGRMIDLLQCDLVDEFTPHAPPDCEPDGVLPHKVKKRLDRLQDSLERTIGGLRMLSRELQPQLLRDLGLSAALQALASDISRTTSLTVNFQAKDSAPDDIITSNQALEVYLIAQEALANIVKHSKATAVEIQLDVHGNKIVLIIRDNGMGFEVPEDLTNLARRGGLGVLSMRQRAGNVGGFLAIQSQPGHGTTIRLEVPLNYQG
jgi:signal transduction histidine kinase